MRQSGLTYHVQTSISGVRCDGRDALATPIEFFFFVFGVNSEHSH